MFSEGSFKKDTLIKGCFQKDANAFSVLVEKTHGISENTGQQARHECVKSEPEPSGRSRKKK